MLFGVEETVELVVHNYHLWHEAKMLLFPDFDIWPCVTFTGNSDSVWRHCCYHFPLLTSCSLLATLPKIPQRWPHAGRLSAAHGQGGDLLPASRPGAVQPGAELHRQEGGAVERLQWGEAQGEHLGTLRPLLSLRSRQCSSPQTLGD